MDHFKSTFKLIPHHTIRTLHVVYTKKKKMTKLIFNLQTTVNLSSYLSKVNETQVKTENIFSAAPPKSLNTASTFGATRNYKPVTLDDYDSLVGIEEI